MERYDWPLLTVVLLVALFMTATLRVLWTVLGLLARIRLRIGR